MGSDLQARSAAIIWTPARAAQLSLDEARRVSPEIAAAVAAAITVLAQLLREQLDHRARRRGERRTRKGD